VVPKLAGRPSPTATHKGKAVPHPAGASAYSGGGGAEMAAHAR
jgi:hypothetical protein